MSKVTPMIQQYLEIKEKYQDAILFYRMGDFYEMFFEDAVVASRELEITLTSRDKQAQDPIPMCGVPHRAADAYIAKLLDQGHKVALCEQVEDPCEAKGLVKREVVKVVTPGTALDSLESKSPNYLAAVYWEGQECALAFLDLSTADFRMTQTENPEWLLEELGRVDPRELLVPADKDHDLDWWQRQVEQCSVQVLEETSFDLSRAQTRLADQFQVHSLEGFGVRHLPLAVRAAGAILTYVQQTQKQAAEHIRRVVPYRRSDYMIIDEVTARHLELFKSWHDGGRKGTLLGLLDQTVTAMGGRLLKHWMNYPLIEVEDVVSRQDAIACCRQHEAIRAQVRQELERVYDLERLNSRVAMGSATPRDLSALRRSLHSLPRLIYLLDQLEDPILSRLANELDPLDDMATLLEEALVDNPPPTLSDGGVMRPGYNEELDRLLTLSRDAKTWIVQLEVEERHKTGIASLKVGYNKIFGYYLEVSKANQARVPDRYIRKQTLVNAERYITEELKSYETQVLTADETRSRLEEALFQELRSRVAGQGERIQKSAAVVAELDVLVALAEVANRRNYFRPKMESGNDIHIEEGRHPMVEASIAQGGFVPNDLNLDDQSQQVLIITGPNMAGKSTILRQTALIVLMAQMGAPVPATSARLGVVDRIFTRVGATDELTRGRSTFMVEMQETAHILHHATERSLVILDEIGRGTSTFDGLSIAWAVAEFLHDWQGVGIKTLFATHYHELTDLAATRGRVKNLNVAVKEWGDKIVFLRKLVQGGTNRSYGIQVSRLAGLPVEVVERAREVLKHLEQASMDVEGLPRLGRSSSKGASEAFQLALFQQPENELRRRLLSIDPERLTPLEALNLLARLRQLAEEKQVGG
ncbi:MAG: DNA mismatch repair protein MutS [Deltaproteobacteria bacterium]|nr:MAG: DNA mismatch repair protein MutS [Deltaproteobacteria bacterium]